jgi:hypothetical protein
MKGKTKTLRPLPTHRSVQETPRADQSVPHCRARKLGIAQEHRKRDIFRDSVHGWKCSLLYGDTIGKPDAFEFNEARKQCWLENYDALMRGHSHPGHRRW